MEELQLGTSWEISAKKATTYPRVLEEMSFLQKAEMNIISGIVVSTQKWVPWLR